MKENVIEFDKNRFLHVIKTDKFKTSFIACFLLSNLKKEDITINALIPAVLTQGTKNYPTMKDINFKLDELYGATLDGSSDKLGDKQALQFYITTIDDKYALKGEKLLNESLKLLLDVIYNPIISNNAFDNNIVKIEKENLKELIKARINDKASYSISRMIEEMFKDSPYGEYKYGRIEDLDKINPENLYNQYKKVLKESEIHFFICSSSEVDMNLFEVCKEYPYDNSSSTNYISKSVPGEKKKIENQEVVQGKLVLGYDVDIKEQDDLYKMQVYNAILGGSSNSKMFQNVREKESLAYTARSIYYRHKSFMILFAGIEIEKYEKALNTIKKQVEDMSAGVFTDEDIKDAKVFLENIMKSYEDSQDLLIDMKLGQLLLGMNDSIDEMIKKINNVSRDDILAVARKVSLNTEYFLTAK